NMHAPSKKDSCNELPFQIQEKGFLSCRSFSLSEECASLYPPFFCSDSSLAMRGGPKKNGIQRGLDCGDSCSKYNLSALMVKSLTCITFLFFSSDILSLLYRNIVHISLCHPF